MTAGGLLIVANDTNAAPKNAISTEIAETGREGNNPAADNAADNAASTETTDASGERSDDSEDKKNKERQA